MKTPSELPAFPNSPDTLMYKGLSKREYFAAAALQGLLANARIQELAPGKIKMGEFAIQFADELLKQLAE